METNWKDSDSSSSNATKENFPDATEMICGGHDARSHLKEMEKLSSLKVFSEGMRKKHKKKDFQKWSLWCATVKRHTPLAVAACRKKGFMEHARNNFYKCTGRLYTTRNKITCPFHALANQIEIENYKIEEIENWTAQANSFVHPQAPIGLRHHTTCLLDFKISTFFWRDTIPFQLILDFSRLTWPTHENKKTQLITGLQTSIRGWSFRYTGERA